ncbi:transglycosylase SLT domain-containing protein [Clostridium ihumii]|uniref:transglycosylase SLT domain-containing protein n=1 Tax=Clostridium ihumii TaxID=1470356 RepID=UPI0005906738|nr:transglycosylase SLT domain-containing protein [Clostridium ihumii]
MKKLIIALVTVGIVGVSGILFVRQGLYPLNHKIEIKKYAEKYNVEPALVAATIHFETNFKETPYKEGKPSGLMNINDESGIRIANEANIKIDNKEEVALADNNINIGTFYISKIFNEKNYKEMMAKWIERNGEVEEADKVYASQYYGEKIEKREKIYKFLYPSLK